MGLDIYLGKVCKPKQDDITFNTLQYPQLNIFENVAQKVTKRMTYLPNGKYCYSEDLIVTKKGIYKYKDVLACKFEDLIESELTFFEFSIQDEICLSHWFADEALKPTIDFPFIWNKEQALNLITSCKDKTVLYFLQKFEMGVHLIYLSY